MNKPNFSVIIPVYNSEKHLRKCITSIINQSYTSIEIVIINDGSKDGSISIMKSFAKSDKRIRIYDTPNRGVSEARNLGINKSRGNYIMFIDSDDFLMHSNVIRKISQKMTNNTDLLLFDLEPRDSSYPIKIAGGAYSDNDIDDVFLPEALRVSAMNSPCNKIYRKQLLIENSIYFDKIIKFGEDLMFNIAYFKHCKKIYYLDQALYYYRDTEGSATNQYMENKYEQIMVVNDKLDNWLKQKGNKKLIDLSKAFRFQSIFNCIGDLYTKKNSLTNMQKKIQIYHYKKEYPYFLIRNNFKTFINSLLYSAVPSSILHEIFKLKFRNKV